jgi:hypothetical protein
MSRISRRLVPVALFALCLALVPAATLAQDHGHDHAHGEHGEHGHDHEDPAADMAAMMALAQPGEHHEHMGKFAGSWKVKTTMWQQPGAEPITGGGTTVNTPILGGRFVQSSFNGDFMGMPFEGFGLEGFDNLSGKHVSMWADNMGTMMMQFEGECSDNHKVVTMMSDFKVPGQKLKMKTVTTMHDQNSYTMEGWVGPNEAQMFKTMEIAYTRQ